MLNLIHCQDYIKLLAYNSSKNRHSEVKILVLYFWLKFILTAFLQCVIAASERDNDRGGARGRGRGGGRGGGGGGGDCYKVSNYNKNSS